MSRYGANPNNVVEASGKDLEEGSSSKKSTFWCFISHQRFLLWHALQTDISEYLGFARGHCWCTLIRHREGKSGQIDETIKATMKPKSLQSRRQALQIHHRRLVKRNWAENIWMISGIGYLFIRKRRKRSPPALASPHPSIHPAFGHSVVYCSTEAVTQHQ